MSESETSPLTLATTQIGADNGLVLADRLRRSFGDDPALGHDDHPVGDVHHDVHVVLDKDHGHAQLIAKALDVSEERLDQCRVHPGHGFVQAHQVGLHHQRPSHLEQLALAAGQRASKVLAFGVPA